MRYSTTGSSTWRNAQPVYRSVGDAGFALGHNGNLTNTIELAEELGLDLATIGSDSDVMGELLAREYSDEPRSDGRDLEGPLERVLPRLRGAFSLVLMDDARLIGVRDPNGFRPLVLGRLEGGWVLASETAALDIVGARPVREIEPAEMIVIDATGVREYRYAEPDPKLCLFEFVYFARPDSELYGQNVHAARQRMGEELARQAPAKADMVMPVPESGVPAAQGFARASGIPYGDGLVKNRYVGRTFIAPTQQLRAMGVRLKLNPLVENIAGKRLVVVDDSIVRGRRPARSCRCSGRRGRPRCTCGSRRRRTAGRASTGWTPAGAPSCWPPTCPWARSGPTSGPTRWPTWSCPACWPPPGRRRRPFAAHALRASIRCRSSRSWPASRIRRTAPPTPGRHPWCEGPCLI